MRYFLINYALDGSDPDISVRQSAMKIDDLIRHMSSGPLRISGCKANVKGYEGFDESIPERLELEVEILDGHQCPIDGVKILEK